MTPAPLHLVEGPVLGGRAQEARVTADSAVVVGVAQRSDGALSLMPPAGGKLFVSDGLRV
jgi:hypothetical protein